MAVPAGLSDMKASAKMGLAVGAILIVVLAGFLLMKFTEKPYATLFSELSPQDAGGIIADLERQKIPYEIAAGGEQILIPKEKVQEIRLKLMGSGVALKGGLGFELFDKGGFGMTDFSQKINYQRALQGELVRTIMSFKEVKFARVHLVLPEQGVFKQNKTPSSASVTVILKDNQWLRPQQIEGIQRLIAASVPGMEMNAVTIIDQSGIALSQMQTKDQGELEHQFGQRLQRKQELEMYLMRKAQTILNNGFGDGHAFVSVDVKLNLNQVKFTKESVIPEQSNNAVVKSRETRQGGDDKKGIAANVVKEIEYHHGKKVEQVVMYPGEVEHMSVGVVVPLSTSTSRIGKMRDLVSMAVGLNEQRGDVITVHAMEMAASTEKRFSSVAEIFNQNSMAAVTRSTSLEQGDTEGNDQEINLAAEANATQERRQMSKSNDDLAATTPLASVFHQQQKLKENQKSDAQGSASVAGGRTPGATLETAHLDAQMTEKFTHLSQLISAQPLWLSLGAPAAGILMTGFLFFRKRSKNNVISEENVELRDKEKVLVQLREWLEKDDAKAEVRP